MGQNVDLICYVKQANDPWKICIPDASLNKLVLWYHTILNYTGITRLYETMALHVYHRDLRMRIETTIGSCAACQRYKLVGKGYGELPPRQAQLAPWSEIAVDLIGPWAIKIPPDHTLVLNALTCIDMVKKHDRPCGVTIKDSESGSAVHI